jgi:PilZ domain
MADDELQGTSERRDARFAVEGVRGSFLLTADARVVNLSIDGMAIETETPLEVGRTYSLVLARGEHSLRIEGRVVWCSLVRTQRGESDEIHAIYRAGIRFREMLTAGAEQLAEFIRENSVVSLEKRLFGRFRLARDKAATVGAEAEFVVREMSQSGMLIETDLAPRVDSLHHMELRFPDARFEADVRIARLEALNSDPSTAPNLHRLGVEFISLDDEARAALSAILAPETE